MHVRGRGVATTPHVNRPQKSGKDICLRSLLLACFRGISSGGGWAANAGLEAHLQRGATAVVVGHQGVRGGARPGPTADDGTEHRALSRHTSEVWEEGCSRLLGTCQANTVTCTGVVVSHWLDEGVDTPASTA